MGDYDSESGNAVMGWNLQGGTALILGMAPCRVDRGKNEYGDVLKSRFLFPLGSSRTESFLALG